MIAFSLEHELNFYYILKINLNASRLLNNILIHAPNKHQVNLLFPKF